MKNFGLIFASLLVVCVGLAKSSDETSALIPCKGSKADLTDNDVSNDWSYSWQSSDRAEFKDRVAVTANGALLINRFTNKDHGTYTCRISKGNTTLEEVSVNVDDSYELPIENCHPSGCISAGKCNSPLSTHSCPDEGEVCCSVVRDEDKQLCRHFLGECMKTCSPQVQVLRASDCQDGTTCCVLV